MFSSILSSTPIFAVHLLLEDGMPIEIEKFMASPLVEEAWRFLQTFDWPVLAKSHERLDEIEKNFIRDEGLTKFLQRRVEGIKQNFSVRFVPNCLFELAAIDAILKSPAEYEPFEDFGFSLNFDLGVISRERKSTKKFINGKLAENEEVLQSANFSDPVKLLYAKVSQALLTEGGLDENAEKMYESFVNFDYVRFSVTAMAKACAYYKDPSAENPGWPDEQFCRMTRKRIVSWVKFLARKELEEFVKPGNGVFLLRGIMSRSKIDFYKPIKDAESFGNSFFAGYLRDSTACSMNFMLLDGSPFDRLNANRNKYELEQVLLKFKISDYIFNNENVADFVYVAPLSVPLGLLSSGEAFHSALFVPPAEGEDDWLARRNAFVMKNSALLSGRIDEIEKEVVDEFLEIVNGDEKGRFSSIVQKGDWFFMRNADERTVQPHLLI